MNRLILSVLLLSVSVLVLAAETWSVGQAKVDGIPIVYKFMGELPEQKIRSQMSWLTVVSWNYDGTDNNGMPPNEVNQAMIRLEDGLQNIVGRGSLYYDVYAATGNNLKEFVFYIADCETFMDHFNTALEGHSAYPIEVNFYQDEHWSDLLELQQVFAASVEK